MTDVSSRVRRGFSLIELLTVIGIIVVLVAILLPVTAKAREMARQVTCASNMRQLVQATFSYAADNNGFLPQPNHAQIEKAASYPLIGWLYAPTAGNFQILPTPLNMAQPDAQAETGSLWPYLKSHGVYHCPDDTDLPYPAGQPAHYLTSFMMNCAVVGFDGDTIGSLQAGVQNAPVFYAYPLRRMPSQGVLFWEAAETPGAEGPYTWNDGCDAPYEGISSRHSGGSQIVMFNGSVEWMSQAQIQQEITQMPGRFYCAPGVANGF